MKLISINKLKAIIGHWYERKHVETLKFPESISITELTELIESTPTVQAIPIDKPFLKMRYGDYVVYNKKWLVNHLQTEWNILQGKEYKPSIPIEWIEKYKRVRGWEVTVTTQNAIDNMLNTWEKENEID